MAKTILHISHYLYYAFIAWLFLSASYTIESSIAYSMENPLKETFGVKSVIAAAVSMALVAFFARDSIRRRFRSLDARKTFNGVILISPVLGVFALVLPISFISSQSNLDSGAIGRIFAISIFTAGFEELLMRAGIAESAYRSLGSGPVAMASASFFSSLVIALASSAFGNNVFMPHFEQVLIFSVSFAASTAYFLSESLLTSLIANFFMRFSRLTWYACLPAGILEKAISSGIPYTFSSIAIIAPICVVVVSYSSFLFYSKAKNPGE